MFGFMKRDATFDSKLEQSVTRTVKDILTKVLTDTETTLGKIRSAFNLEGKIKALQEELETLKIEKDRKDEQFARREREVEHKVGLERKRQEFEIQQARREVMVEVKEKNLKKDKERFEEQMDFHKEAMAEEVKSLRDMVGKLLKALPSAEIIARVGKED